MKWAFAENLHTIAEFHLQKSRKWVRMRNKFTLGCLEEEYRQNKKILQFYDDLLKFYAITTRV
jgi:hypothetical protein